METQIEADDIYPEVFFSTPLRAAPPDVSARQIQGPGCQGHTFGQSVAECVGKYLVHQACGVQFRDLELSDGELDAEA